MDIAQAIRDLYAAPLAEFTPRRNALAKALTDEGKKEDAARVKALKKPRLSAWIVNQLARSQPAATARLVAATRAAQDAGSRDDLRTATRDRADAVRELVDAAQGLLREQGRGGGGTILHEITQTLQAATADDDLDRLAAGTLATPVEAAGFASAQASFEPPPDDISTAEEQRRQEAAQLGEDLERARSDVREAERVAARTRAEADAADAAVDALRRGVARLEAKLSKVEGAGSA